MCSVQIGRATSREAHTFPVWTATNNVEMQNANARAPWKNVLNFDFIL